MTSSAWILGTRQEEMSARPPVTWLEPFTGHPHPSKSASTKRKSFFFKKKEKRGKGEAATYRFPPLENDPDGLRRPFWPPPRRLIVLPKKIPLDEYFVAAKFVGCILSSADCCSRLVTLLTLFCRRGLCVATPCYRMLLLTTPSLLLVATPCYSLLLHPRYPMLLLANSIVATPCYSLLLHPRYPMLLLTTPSLLLRATPTLLLLATSSSIPYATPYFSFLATSSLLLYATPSCYLMLLLLCYSIPCYLLLFTIFSSYATSCYSLLLYYYYSMLLNPCYSILATPSLLLHLLCYSIYVQFHSCPTRSETAGSFA